MSGPASQVPPPATAFKGAAALFALLCLTGDAKAQDRADIAGSIVALQPTAQPGAVAEVLFVNIPTNHFRDNGEYTLTRDGLTVVVTFTWGNAGDAIAVAVPDGYIADPAYLEQPEDSTGVVYIYSGETVGM